MATELQAYETSRKRPLAAYGWRVAGLALLSGSGWLLTEAYPSEMGFPFAGCIHFAVIGLAGSISARWKGWTRGKIAAVAAAGLGLFVLPGIVGTLMAGAVSGASSVALFCAVPVVLVLGMPWFGDGTGSGLRMPSLVGLLGALLIFPVDLPESLRMAIGIVTVIACCVVVAAASVWMFKLLQGVGVAAAVTVVGMTGAVVLGGYGVGVGWPRMALSAFGLEAVRCVVFDLPVVWFTVWLAREAAPGRLAARFLLAPVVTWLQGYALVRGPVPVRNVVGLVLMATGAAMLLFKRDEADEVEGLRLR